MSIINGAVVLLVVLWVAILTAEAIAASPRDKDVA